MKTAIIAGVQGQDGQLLYEYLQKKKYCILGIDKDITKSHNIEWKNKIDICLKQDIELLIKKLKPDEIYFLAAHHHSSEDAPLIEHLLFSESNNINVLSLNNFLHAILTFSPCTRIFYASSSMIYGETECEVQDENTPFSPNTIYGITKLCGLLLCRYYRRKYRIFTSSGILFNHESHFR